MVRAGLARCVRTRIAASLVGALAAEELPIIWEL